MTSAFRRKIRLLPASQRDNACGKDQSHSANSRADPTERSPVHFPMPRDDACVGPGDISASVAVQDRRIEGDLDPLRGDQASPEDAAAAQQVTRYAANGCDVIGEHDNRTVKPQRILEVISTTTHRLFATASCRLPSGLRSLRPGPVLLFLLLFLCFLSCCCLFFSLSFLPPLSPMSTPFQPSCLITALPERMFGCVQFSTAHPPWRCSGEHAAP